MMRFAERWKQQYSRLADRSDCSFGPTTSEDILHSWRTLSGRAAAASWAGEAVVAAAQSFWNHLDHSEHGGYFSNIDGKGSCIVNMVTLSEKCVQLVRVALQIIIQIRLTLAQIRVSPSS